MVHVGNYFSFDFKNMEQVNTHIFILAELTVMQNKGSVIKVRAGTGIRMPAFGRCDGRGMGLCHDACTHAPAHLMTVV